MKYSNRDSLTSPGWLVQRYWLTVSVLIIWTITIFTLAVCDVIIAQYLVVLSILTGVILLVIIDIIAWRIKKLTPLKSWGITILIILSGIPSGLSYAISYSGLCSVSILLSGGIFSFLIIWGEWTSIKNPIFWKMTLKKIRNKKEVIPKNLEGYGKFLYDPTFTKQAIKRKKEKYEQYLKYKRNNRILIIVISISLSILILFTVKDTYFELITLSIMNSLILCFGLYVVLFYTKESVKKFKSKYDFMIFEKGILLPNHSIEPSISVFIPKDEIIEIYWNEGHNYLLIVFNEPPIYENKINRKFQILPKDYIDDLEMTKDILEKYYKVKTDKVLLKEDII